VIAAACGLEVVPDARLAERMNWTSASGLTWPQFLAEWARSSADPDYVPAVGESSRRAGERLGAALAELAAAHRDGLVLAVSHGGVTVDFLRAVLGDDELARRAGGVIAHGLPACAITRLRRAPSGWEALSIGDDGHLHGSPLARPGTL
jgi:broad specificity phosphatase PhoE